MSGYISEDLIVEIFTRLPTKSLLRFRSLSKSLCSCIDSPNFIRTHTLRSPQKVLIKHLVYNKEESGIGDFYTLHTKDQLPTHCRRYIGMEAIKLPYCIDSECIGSCNGIICVSDCDNGISLWNLSIRRKLTVPDCLGGCSSRCPQRCSCGARRVQDGFGFSPIRVGFGFDPITDDYKIVSLPRCGGTGESSYVYTMKTGAWCAITSSTPFFCKVTSRGCFVNGALHWVVQHRFRELGNDVKHHYILTFDLSTHLFGKIALPEPSWRTKQLLTIQGCLGIIMKKSDSCIWVMREYNNSASWYVFFKTKTLHVEGQLQRVLQLTSNGDLLFSTNCEAFQAFNPKRRARVRLMNHNAGSVIFDMEMCIESLQLLDMGTTCKGDEPSLFEEKKRSKKLKLANLMFSIIKMY